MDTLEKSVATGKIFGVGLHKTGTSSLHHALSLLGFRSFHAAGKHRKISEKTGTLFPQSIMSHYDAFTDHPFPTHFKEADREYPNSKFILTVRDLDSWLQSVRRHIKRNQSNPFYRGAFGHYDETKEIALWHQHIEDVMTYFTARPNDFLIMNIIEGDGWTPLCAFLDLPVPPGPFPHWNKSVSRPYHLASEFLKWLRGKYK